jgi:hypothetical protein
MRWLVEVFDSYKFNAPVHVYRDVDFVDVIGGVLVIRRGDSTWYVKEFTKAQVTPAMEAGE